MPWSCLKLNQNCRKLFDLKKNQQNYFVNFLELTRRYSGKKRSRQISRKREGKSVDLPRSVAGFFPLPNQNIWILNDRESRKFVATNWKIFWIMNLDSFWIMNLDSFWIKNLDIFWTKIRAPFPKEVGGFFLVSGRKYYLNFEQRKSREFVTTNWKIFWNKIWVENIQILNQKPSSLCLRWVVGFLEFKIQEYLQFCHCIK